MWHQKGEMLKATSPKGYFLKIEDVPNPVSKLPGLAEKLGFNTADREYSKVSGLNEPKTYRRRIGPVENRKLVKEAIVAIPYVIREDDGNKVEFIKFHTGHYDDARTNVETLKKELESKPLTDEITTIRQYREFLKNMDIRTKTLKSDSPINAIEYQLFMMDEYILPPQLDFLRNDVKMTSPNPFMMYFFQFHASFNQEDLSNIWQNLYPTTADSTANPRYSYTNDEQLSRLRPHNDTSYVSHYLETVDFKGSNLSPAADPRATFSPKDKNNKTRWLVFKVKQRGKTSLEEIRKLSIDPRSSNIEKMEYVKDSKSSLGELALPEGLPGRLEDGTTSLQYNWPYDYFSFVELIKLETKIDSYNYDSAALPAVDNFPDVSTRRTKD